ncbi:MAG TPA: universal stress protein [Bdellovibrionota bacterium]|nr:universal stress protein [Bdellovibrionota bacterium]
MAAIKKILVPIDFSPATEDIVKFVTDFAKPLGSEVELLHVAETSDIYANPPLLYSDREFFETRVATLKEEIEALLQKYSDLMAKKGIKVHATWVSGNPFIEIVKIAKEKGFDLIAMGSHGRSGLEHVFLGSVAEQVLHNSPCPVLTLKKRGFKFKPLWHG